MDENRFVAWHSVAWHGNMSTNIGSVCKHASAHACSDASPLHIPYKERSQRLNVQSHRHACMHACTHAHTHARWRTCLGDFVFCLGDFVLRSAELLFSSIDSSDVDSIVAFISRCSFCVSVPLLFILARVCAYSCMCLHAFVRAYACARVCI